MRLKTFTAPDINSAMAQIRAALGDDAVIISTTRDPVSKGVTVTAALEGDDADNFAEDAFPFAPPPANAAAYLSAQSSVSDFLLPRSNEAKVFIELKATLAYHSVPADVTDHLLETAQMLNFDPDTSFEGIRKTLGNVLEASFQFLPLPLNRAGFRLMLIGTPGVGKTMTIAKMAAQMVMEKKAVTVITTDTKRAGGVEQLQAFTDILGLDLKIAANRHELRQILQECSDEERVLIDSAGTNPYNAQELKDLGEFLGVGNVEAILAIPAGGDAQEAAYLSRAFGFTHAKRMIFTRSDLSRRYGSILSAAFAGNYAFCNSSSSARVIGEYQTVNADYLSNLLMQYRME
jgi:flagellar biosynthesis protein FlhF